MLVSRFGVGLMTGRSRFRFRANTWPWPPGFWNMTHLIKRSWA